MTSFGSIRRSECALTFYVFLFFTSSCLSQSWSYKDKVRGRVGGGGLRGGGERLSEMSNGIGEPTCEELRAMWRYHKRQSRAELTNQIPTFDQVYWQLPPITAHGYPPTFNSFGSVKNMKNFKLNSRARSRASRHGQYGQVNYYGQGERTGAPRQLRPMEQVWKEVKLHKDPPQASTITQPVIHLSPPRPAGPTSPTSFQQLQQLVLEERQRSNLKDTEDETKDDGGRKSEEERQFGSVVLAPPVGQDGRIANKNPALMTPFEKLRFGHMRFSDNEDGGGGPEVTKRGLFYYPIRSTRMREPRTTTTTTTTAAPHPSYRLPHLQSAQSASSASSSSQSQPSPIDQQDNYPLNMFRQQFQPPPIPSVFSFWRRQLLPQDPPSHPHPQTRMVDSIPSCSLVQGSPCTLNQHCHCSGTGLYRCHQGLCHFLNLPSSVSDLEDSGNWHDDPFDSESELGLWQDSDDGQEGQLSQIDSDTGDTDIDTDADIDIDEDVGLNPNPDMTLIPILNNNPQENKLEK